MSLHNGSISSVSSMPPDGAADWHTPQIMTPGCIETKVTIAPLTRAEELGSHTTLSLENDRPQRPDDPRDECAFHKFHYTSHPYSTEARRHAQDELVLLATESQEIKVESEDVVEQRLEAVAHFDGRILKIAVRPQDGLAYDTRQVHKVTLEKDDDLSHRILDNWRCKAHSIGIDPPESQTAPHERCDASILSGIVGEPCHGISPELDVLHGCIRAGFGNLVEQTIHGVRGIKQGGLDESGDRKAHHIANALTCLQSTRPEVCYQIPVDKVHRPVLSQRKEALDDVTQELREEGDRVTREPVQELLNAVAEVRDEPTGLCQERRYAASRNIRQRKRHVFAQEQEALQYVQGSVEGHDDDGTTKEIEGESHRDFQAVDASHDPNVHHIARVVDIGWERYEPFDDGHSDPCKEL